MHYEKFEVVTAANGESSLKFELACATAIDHYIRCTDLQKNKLKEDNLICSTGLRVYEGAQVLAAFLFRFGRTLLPHSSKENNSLNVKDWVVELGCGCGLVGFSTAVLFPELSIAFTDASVECLKLINASAKKLNLILLPWDNSEFKEAFKCTPERILISYPLEWSKECTFHLTSLIDRFFGSEKGLVKNNIRLVLGSDLLYYRVDIRALLETCRSFLQPSEIMTNKEDDANLSEPRLAILAHFMRIPAGKSKLQMIAYEMGFGIVRVPLEAFIEVDILQKRGWNGISIILLFLHSSRCLKELETFDKGKIIRQLEEDDLEEAKRRFCSGRLSFPSEALACYSEESVKNDVKKSSDTIDGCDLDNLPYCPL